MTLTPEQFLAQPSDEAEDYDIEPLEPGAADPLESIAVSLQRLVDLITSNAEDEKAADRMFVAFDDLEAKHGALLEVLSDVEAALGKSTAKPALAAKAVIEAWRNPEPAAESGKSESATERHTATVAIEERPDRDDTVEDWRAYARAQGYAGSDVDQMNRSQIRTMLGIEHGDAAR